jgi:hypothetical protein
MRDDFAVIEQIASQVGAITSTIRGHLLDEKYSREVVSVGSLIEMLGELSELLSWGLHRRVKGDISNAFSTRFMQAVCRVDELIGDFSSMPEEEAKNAIRHSVDEVDRMVAELMDECSLAMSPALALKPDEYDHILQVISDAGVAMERHPSVYDGKDEEALRDHFITVLSSHFQSATGESFNKKGKTDILIRHEKQNVFVAECKFWNGIKGFHSTIDQLLGYLTWRDSKAAVISFVKNKELTRVLEAIVKETPSHGCFVKYQGNKKDGWFMFEFHLPGDPGRSVQLAVMVFHFP